MTSTNEMAPAPSGDADKITSPPSSTSDTGSDVRFEDLGLSPQLLKAVADAGYTKPTPIQAQGIPPVLKGRDIIGIAQTGTGKTASFTLPMIELLSRGRAKARMPRTLILEPTRELAAQVAESFERYGKHHKLSMALLIGGVSFDEQDRKLDRGVDVLIATPGRLLDHFERGKLMLSGVQILVIDEADRMLDMGFIPDVERIAKLIPFTRQTLFYSATMPPEIRRLTDQFLQAPVRIEVSKPATAATTIVQMAVTVQSDDWAKRAALRQLVREQDVKNAIVFCNRKRDVDIVAKSLQKHGFSAAALHGDLDQSVRTRTLELVPLRRTPSARGERCRGSRPRHSGGQSHLQFRRAIPGGRLCPSHRTDRACGTHRSCLHASDAPRREERCRDREVDGSAHRAPVDRSGARRSACARTPKGPFTARQEQHPPWPPAKRQGRSFASVTSGRSRGPRRSHSAFSCSGSKPQTTRGTEVGRPFPCAVRAKVCAQGRTQPGCRRVAGLPAATGEASGVEAGEEVRTSA